MFALSLRQDDHVRNYSISPAGSAGWEVRMEEDQNLRRLDHYHDWHRVERALAAFENEALELMAQGWAVTGLSQPLKLSQ